MKAEDEIDDEVENVKISDSFSFNKKHGGKNELSASRRNNGLPKPLQGRGNNIFYDGLQDEEVPPDEPRSLMFNEMRKHEKFHSPYSHRVSSREGADLRGSAYSLISGSGALNKERLSSSGLHPEIHRVIQGILKTKELKKPAGMYSSKLLDPRQTQETEVNLNDSSEVPTSRQDNSTIGIAELEEIKKRKDNILSPSLIQEGGHIKVAQALELLQQDCDKEQKEEKLLQTRLQLLEMNSKRQSLNFNVDYLNLVNQQVAVLRARYDELSKRLDAESSSAFDLTQQINHLLSVNTQLDARLRHLQQKKQASKDYVTWYNSSHQHKQQAFQQQAAKEQQQKNLLEIVLMRLSLLFADPIELSQEIQHAQSLERMCSSSSSR